MWNILKSQSGLHVHVFALKSKILGSSGYYTQTACTLKDRHQKQLQF